MALPIEDGLLRGDWQQPVNRWMNIERSIHNDETARKVGMRGGTIPGTVHLNHFAPLIQQLWGRRWYERGSISMFYTYASTHLEDVRAVVRMPQARADAEQVEAFVELKEGSRIVCRGTMSVGNCDAVPYVRAIALQDAPRSELRILAAIETGMTVGPRDVEPAAALGGSGDYAGIVEHPTALVGLLGCGMPKGIGQGVGFFGATELRIHRGPVRIGGQYQVSGRVACVEASPRTESFWLDTELRDRSSGELVADMRFLHRWMKAGSKAWEKG
jgi:hypothetical protein